MTYLSYLNAVFVVYYYSAVVDVVVVVCGEGCYCCCYDRTDIKVQSGIKNWSRSPLRKGQYHYLKRQFDYLDLLLKEFKQNIP